MNNYRSGSSKNEQEEQFLKERMKKVERMQQESRGQGWFNAHERPYAHAGEPPFMNSKPPRKSKFVAVMLGFFFPGMGHFYLGLMQRGLLMMMLLALDIVTIVYFSTSNDGTNVPLIVLLSLLLPVIYFYNLFDAMQNTDKVNTQALYGTSKSVKQGPWLGILLVVIGLMLMLFTIDPDWLRWLLRNGGSFAGAAVLIAGGIYLLYKESRFRP
ncbi:hypothetical protein [Paenibacillus aquistagni]|uniref:hypothetical protein n=1 Tax=Paenibacillus aquistagni TaxID=1852522 RepID=UPI00145A5D3D|nr:hypothetical protein [Paenibacillus aquistagni]NMM55550.1 hypothetical protein [Paenibacillus aquistagni]